MDVRLIEIDHVMALIARTIQQRADLSNESLALLRLSPTEQLVRLLPRQLEPVQRPADGLAAAAVPKRNCSPPFPKDQAATGMISMPARALVMACSAVRPCRRPVAITEAAAA